MVEGTLKQEAPPTGFAAKVRQLLHGEMVGAVAFSPDGKLVASGGAEDGSVKLWNAATGALVRALAGHTRNVDDLCFAPDGTRLAGAGADRIICLWEVETGRLLVTLGQGEREGSLAFSPDGGTLASVSSRFAEDYRVAYSRVCMRRVTSRAAMGSSEGPGAGELTRRLWDAPPEILAAAPEGPRGMIYSVAFSPDGRRIATGASVVEDEAIIGGDVTLWDAGTQRPVRTISTPGFYVKSVAYSPDGRTLAAGCTQVERQAAGGGKIVASEARLWGLESDTEPRALARLEADACIQRVQFSPDGERLVVDRYHNSGDRDAELWEIDSSRQLQLFPGSQGHGTAALSPDGKLLASAGAGECVQLWRRKARAAA